MKLSVTRIHAFAFAIGAGLVGNAGPSTGAAPPQSSPQVRGLLSKVPLWFEPNEGQTASEVEFLARGPGYALFLAPADITLALSSPTVRLENSAAGHPTGQGFAMAPASPAATTTLRLKLLNANPAPRLVGREPMASNSHYLIGNDPANWRTKVSHFSKVTYQAIYPGVDLVFYGNERQLEFDFLVSPGSDPDRIQFYFEGADSIDVEAGGDLVLTSAEHEIRLHKPVTYQHLNGSRCEVQSSFVLLDESRVAFRVSDYDVSQTLVIDPVLSFASYVGGAAQGVAVDGSGNIYVAGSTRLANLTASPGAVGPSNAGESDVFVMKLSPDGSSVLYATYLGGSKDDLPTGIAVDSQGNAIISGYTFSSDFPLSSTQLGGKVDPFVAKLNATGTALVYSRYLGGKPRFEMEPLSIDFGMVRDDQPKDATVTIRNTGTVPFTVCAGTGGGAVTFVGTTASCLTGFENEHVNFNAKITVPALSQTSFTIRFDPIGRGHDKGTIGFHNGDQGIFAEFIWKGEGIRAPFPPDPAPEDPPRPFLNIPPFFIEFGDSDDFANGVAVDPAGNAYVVGTTASANFPAPNSIQPYRGSLEDGKSLNDAFVTKLSPEGQVLLSTYLGGSGSDSALGVTVDGNGDIYVGGNTSSDDFPEPVTALQRLAGGNGFVTKLSAAGARVYSTLLGGISVADVAVDSAGAVYMTGSGGGSQLPTPKAFQTVYGGGRSDAFTAKLNPGGASLAYFTWLGGFGDDEGNAIAVDSSGSGYVTGYTQSSDFPPKDPLQANNAGGSSSLPPAGDAFITKVAPDGSDILFSTYLGDFTADVGLGIALNPNGDIIVAGSGGIPPKNAPAGWATPTGGFVAMISQGQPAQEIQVWQLMEVPNPMGANPGLASLKPASSPANFRVVFSRNVGGVRIEAEAEIIEVTGAVIRFRVPVDLLGPSDVQAPPLGVDPNVTLEIFSRPDGRLLVRMVNIVLRLPQPIIVDEMDVRLDPVASRNVLQFLLNAPSPANQTFVFLGRSSDGGAGLRVLNTALRFPQPLRFEADDVVVFEPNPATGRFRRIGTPFHIPNLGPGDQGLQFNVSQNGLHVITIEASPNSPGPFPARYQLHLAANVGLPQRLINGVTEFPRGTRLDTLFNHPAPRPHGLFPGTIGVARTALFKFANVVSISQFAQAVLLPPPGGFTAGTRIVRAADPARPLGFTTPTARTPENVAPLIGTVLDFTQIPIPESLAQPPPPAGPLTETVGAVIGANDGNGLTLPKTFANNATVSSVILDMGSGYEIVDGAGADFEVLATSGSYTVRVGNTPYADSFSAALGPFSGVQQIDLATAGLKSARYVWIIPASSVVLDAVRSLNLFADEISPTVGAITHVKSTTITARRAKDGTNLLDPFVQLIAPNGDLFAENEAGFGDDLSPDLSDAALINRILPQDGFYRYLVKGYDKQPDNQSSGTFFTRLETSGNYDQVELAVSTASEEQTVPQKAGTISATRQRDSFLFQAAPGTRISIAINAKSGVVELDPAVELYDPEDFLIAANDNGGTTRSKNPALLNVVLPATTTGGSAAPSPSTYRIVVSALDGFGNPSPLPVAGQAHLRQTASGGYELKVFTGTPAGGVPRPRIDNINPTSGPAGTPVIITGANFNSAASQNVVRFGNAQATVSSASARQIVTAIPASLSPGAVSVSVSVADQTSAPANFMVTALVQTAKEAQASLHCLSLRFQRATGTVFGERFDLELTSLSFDEPANGELTTAFPPSYTSSFILKGLALLDPFRGILFVALPQTGDSNKNGLDDFFEVSRGVNATTTDGTYTSDFDEGTVKASWSRAAGSRTGSCQIELKGDDSGLEAEFTVTFELLEYGGPLTYTITNDAVSANVRLAQTPGGADVLTGPLQLTRISATEMSQLDIAEGTWTNTVGKKLEFGPSTLKRSATAPSNFSADLFFLDGDLSTVAEDYFDWVLIVTDPNDSDSDGIPDLNDLSAVQPPSTLKFESIRFDTSAIVVAWQGNGRLQSAATLSGPWNDEPVAESPARITPKNQIQFFRLLQP